MSLDSEHHQHRPHTRHLLEKEPRRNEEEEEEESTDDAGDANGIVTVEDADEDFGFEDLGATEG